MKINGISGPWTSPRPQPGIALQKYVVASGGPAQKFPWDMTIVTTSQPIGSGQRNDPTDERMTTPLLTLTCQQAFARCWCAELTLSVADGERWIVGPRCGKTTLFAMISVKSADVGEISLAGGDHRVGAAARTRLGIGRTIRCIGRSST